MLDAIDIGKDFLSRMKAAHELRERINKLDYMKFKIFCPIKENVSKLKKTFTAWNKIFTSYTLDKGLIISIYRELKKLFSKKSMSYCRNGQMN
jgi:hypothetical protein